MHRSPSVRSSGPSERLIAPPAGGAGGQVVRRRLGAPRRRRPVLAALAAGQVVLADVGGLQQRELELANVLSALRRPRASAEECGRPADRR